MKQLHTAKKLERPAISKLVQSYIRDYILNHGLRPDDALPSQVQIAKYLGVSRSSVREAVRALESLGLLEVRHGEGLYMREINFDALLEVLSYSVMLDPLNLMDLLHIRELLEINTITDVINRIKAEDLATCWRILDKWSANLASGQSCMEQDQSFHQTLYQVLENKLLISLANVFWLAYRKAEERIIPAARSRQSVLEHHREILRAVEAKDIELAQRLMSKHFQNVGDRFRMALKSPESERGSVRHEHLVLLYRFDEDTGDLAKDISGKGNDGKITEARWIENSRSGGGMGFNGGTSFIRVPHHQSLDADRGQITIMAWYKPFSFPTDYPPIARKGSEGEGSWGLDTPDGKLRGFIYIAPGITAIAIGNSIMDIDQWNHVAMVYDSKELRLYLNGELEDTISVTGGINKNESPVWIGKRDDKDSVYLHGVMDELAILDTALTESGIKKSMTGGIERILGYQK